MKTIEAYVTSDGKLFPDETKAIDHENEMIGIELDSLFDLFKLKSGNHYIGHQAIYYACINALKDKQKLKSICEVILNIIDGG